MMLTLLPLLVIVVPATLVLAYWIPVWQTRRRVGNPAPDLGGLSGVPASGKRVWLFFHNPSCWRCRLVMPAVDALARRGAQVIPVDVRSRDELRRRFGVRTTPAVVAVEHGQIAEVLVGPRLRETLARIVAG